jgi:hypothetical protein
MPDLEGRRSGDPEKPGWLWKLVLSVKKYPIQTAVLITMMVAAIPIYLLIDSNTELRSQTKDLQEFNTNLQAQRIASSTLFCQAININAEATNTQTAFIANLILGGAYQSAAFEKVYKQFGFPPYDERVKQATDQADSLLTKRVKTLNCDKYVAAVRAFTVGNERERKNLKIQQLQQPLPRVCKPGTQSTRSKPCVVLLLAPPKLPSVPSK